MDQAEMAKWHVEQFTPEKNLPKILSIEAFDGKVQLKMENCRFSLSGMSFLPPPGMDHCRDKLNIYDVGEFARFFKVVKSFLFHYLTHNLVRYLKYFRTSLVLN